MNKYLELANSGTRYAKNMKRLSNRIFGEVTREINPKSMKVVKLLMEVPIQKRTDIVNYYPRHSATEDLMNHLRNYGLFKNEHLDFKEHYDRLRELRGKSKWIPPPLRKQ